MISYEIIYRVLVTILGLPLAAWILDELVARSGSAAVSNTAIAKFILTPSGFLAAVWLAVGYLLGQLWLSSGFMVLAALSVAGRRVSVRDGLKVAFWSSSRLLRLGLMQLGGIALLFAPFLGLAALTYGLLLTGHDINYYLDEKPPSFKVAVGIGVILGLGALATVAVVYVRYVFVLPALLFEPASLRSAARSSRELAKGSALWIGSIVLGWHGLIASLAALLAWLYVAASGALMTSAGTHVTVLLPLAATLLVGHAVLVGALAFTQVAVASLLTVRLYDERSGGRARSWAESVHSAAPRIARVSRWLWGIGAVAGLVGFVAVGGALLRNVRAVRPVTITAHRGSSREAPENTLAAIRKAIEHKADYAEIDVHLTSDGVPVLIHDEDLQRLAGVARRPGELTLKEIQQIDVGSRFNPTFAGERIPTLSDVIELARGQIKLNIELKFTGKRHEPLAHRIADLVRSKDFESHCFVTSLDYQGVLVAHRRNPRLRTGTIVSAAIGNMTRLDVDILSVRTGLITGKLLGRAHASGKEIHAWTVDDPKVMADLIDQGVDSLITNDPATAIAVRRERAEMPVWGRVLLGFRSRLAGR
jgi:glycerophosphoryl diester phosphodiesterase